MSNEDGIVPLLFGVLSGIFLIVALVVGITLWAVGAATGPGATLVATAGVASWLLGAAFAYGMDRL